MHNPVDEKAQNMVGNIEMIVERLEDRAGCLSIDFNNDDLTSLLRRAALMEADIIEMKRLILAWRSFSLDMLGLS